MALLTRIAELYQETDEIRRYRLVAADGGALPAGTPGSHIDVQLESGLVRQYSLCNGPGEQGVFEIAVKREPASRGGSAAVHAGFRVGGLVPVSAPRNSFPLQDDADHHLLLAGGIGITPLLSMARHLAAAGKPFHLHYFVRSARDAAFRELLASPTLRGSVTQHHGLDPAETADVLRAVSRVRPSGGHLYVCGPAPFMACATGAAGAWPEGTVHQEWFAAAPSDSDGAATGRPFRVRLARQDVEFEVAPGQSILQALDAHDIFAPRSCEQGFCGTCEVAVLEGEPDHRDTYLSEEERRRGKVMMPCVSRCRGPLLVLDL
ncbi:PDR/VanB family oxidoreductase [Luteimonas composti]|uniref:PDR/VanB family oxidoreductase n=1 Tax=Luteimonas composti TaxID=398257 RepID=A0ABT6MNU9_9GAMM|nr:PDR/VanB family oxidoreductase [Luteimonas composti]MDH7452228.1 PDR/VanB family oxidoreductase [Luteimonas composti]